jgi:sulfhydrogenase subunit beta (sulfur reductase)
MQDAYFLSKDAFNQLFFTLQQSGYQTIGPTVKEGAIIYDELKDAAQLPWGIRDYQAQGKYRLEKIEENEAFSFANGPQGLKPFLFKPRETVWRVQRSLDGKLAFVPETILEKPIAFIGARACDLVALEIQDRIFIHDKYKYESYFSRRENLFIVAANCTYASNNCFCVSAATGPYVKQNFDLALTELPEGFIITEGTEKGTCIIQQLSVDKATSEQIDRAKKRIEIAAKMQTKKIPVDNQGSLRTILFENLQHPRWNEVADRCLSCGNCTLVCPTCFCHSEYDQASLDGAESEHQREWDSCFTAGHSYANGKVLRDDTRKRYRQWLTHKVGTWFDQFGISGCVGCGRCIAWCPVGIDITEELSAITGDSNRWEGND